MNKFLRFCLAALLLSLLSAGALAQSERIGTVAGNGSYGYTGLSGIAVAMALRGPRGVSVDALGNFYFADSMNHRVCKVTPEGTLTTIAGKAEIPGSAGDGGLAVNAELTNPNSTAVDSLGNLYIVERSRHRIRKVNSAGVITLFAGTSAPGFSGDGGPAISATLYNPQGVAVDRAGNVYVADSENNRIRMINLRGIITTVAGDGNAAYSGDGGAATSASLNSPQGVAVDENGNLYIADYYNNRIRKVNARGIITTVAGDGSYGFGGDGGDATEAILNGPQGISVDVAGNLFITDTLNNRIRKVDADGIISTIVGTDIHGFYGDGGAASDARVYYPSDPAIDAEGNLYFADSGNYRIREIAHLGGIAAYFPQIAVGGGYTTRLTITNYGSTAARATLVFSNGNGTPLYVNGEITDISGTISMDETSVFPVEVPAGGIVFVTATALSPNALLQTGWARLTSTGGSLSSVVSYEWIDEGHFQSKVAIIESRPHQFATIPVDNDTTQKQQLAYALVNPNGVSITIKVALVGLDGAVVNDTKSIKLSPGYQKVGYLEQLLKCSDFKGTVVFRGQSSATFAVMALIDKQNVLTSVPIASGKAPTVPD